MSEVGAGAPIVLAPGAVAQAVVVGPSVSGGAADAVVIPLDPGVSGVTRAEFNALDDRVDELRDELEEPHEYLFTQALASMFWLILHPFDVDPLVIRVIGDGGRSLYPTRVSYPAAGRARIDFSRPVAGTAHLFIP